MKHRFAVAVSALTSDRRGQPRVRALSRLRASRGRRLRGPSRATPSMHRSAEAPRLSSRRSLRRASPSRWIGRLRRGPRRRVRRRRTLRPASPIASAPGSAVSRRLRRRRDDRAYDGRCAKLLRRGGGRFCAGADIDLDGADRVQRLQAASVGSDACALVAAPEPCLGDFDGDRLIGIGTSPGRGPASASRRRAPALRPTSTATASSRQYEANAVGKRNRLERLQPLGAARPTLRRVDHHLAGRPAFER